MTCLQICKGIDLGCFDSCAAVNTGLVAKFTGTHQVNYKKGSTVHYWTFAGIEGFPLSLPNKFKETGESCFTITQPNNCLYDVDGECNFYLTNMPSFNKKKTINLTNKVQEIKTTLVIKPTKKKTKTPIKFLKK